MDNYLHNHKGLIHEDQTLKIIKEPLLSKEPKIDHFKLSRDAIVVSKETHRDPTNHKDFRRDGGSQRERPDVLPNRNQNPMYMREQGIQPEFDSSDMKETIKILQKKIMKLEELVRLKDERIIELGKK
jgi:hypothetical protein